MANAAMKRPGQLLAVVVFSLITLVGVSLRNDRIEALGSAGKKDAIQQVQPIQPTGIATAALPLDSVASGSLTMLADPIKDQSQPSDLSPTRTASDDLSGSLWKAVFYTALMLGAILLVANLVKKYGGDRLSQTSSSDIEIIGRKYLNPKQSIAIIKVREKELLVGITDHTIQLLDRLDTDEG